MMSEYYKTRLSIVIPAHNEAAVIEKTLAGLEEGVRTSHEIIVVADHCADNTFGVAENFAKTHPNVRVISNAREKGFGNAITSGVEAANGEAVLIVMADLCDDPHTIDIMHRALTDGGYDLVCGSRYMRGGKKISGPAIQGFFSSLVSYSLRLLIGIPTWDIANSFKMYRKDFLDRLGYSIPDAGTEYSMRLAARAYFAGAKITEVPTTWRGEDVGFWQEFRIFKRTWKYLNAYMSALMRKIQKANKWRIAFFAVLAALHFLSVGFLYVKNIDPSPIQDPVEYKMIGQNLLAGRGFSVSTKAPYEQDLLRGPSYTLFLAATYYFEKTGWLAIFLQQIFLIISGIFLFKIFEKFGLTKTGYVFTAFYLLEPLQWMLSLQTMSETFYGLFVFAAFYILLARWSEQSQKLSFWPDALAGLSAGIAVLARPVGVLWVPGLALLVLAAGKERWLAKIYRLFVFLFVLVAVVSPWIYRNYLATGRIMLSSSYEYNIVAGFGTNNELASIQQGPPLFDAKGRKGAAIEGFTASANSYVKKLADNVMERIGKTDVMVKQLYCSKKVWFRSQYDVILDMLFKGSGDGAFAGVLNKLDNVFWSFMLVLTGAGLIALYKKVGALAILGVIAILAANVFITFCIAYTRMRAPLLPIIFLLSGFGVRYIYNSIKSR